jgi:Glycosyl transferases, related to UDP-glucuronosyltransferase
MNITLLTAGSRGDVQPYIALGAGLHRAGHRVCLATHDGFQELAQQHGLIFAPVASPSQALCASPVWQRWQASGGDFFRYITGFLQVSRVAVDLLVTMLDDFWSSCRGADLVISSTSGFAGPLLAQEAGVPHCWALFQPMSPTRVFPHFMTPPWLRLGPAFNYLTYRMAEHVYWRLFRPAINRWIISRLGRQDLMGRMSMKTFLGEDRAPVLYGISPQVVPQAPDWGENIRLCGFWNLDRHPNWKPPQELVSFLASGPPPVYFGLARINFRPLDRLVHIVLEALEITGQRGLVYLDQQPMELGSKRDTVMVVSSMPHDWLFPQVSAVVHHGGAGTTAYALRAGVPSVGIPGFYDQPFWSRRVAELQAGVSPISPRQLTAKRLARAIRKMIQDDVLQARACKLGEALRGERGIEVALDFLNKKFENLSTRR